MKQEDKDLLLKDLCARLPYNPLISINGERYRMEEICNALIGVNMYKITVDGCDIEYMDIKPYLFPLSSMTKKQMKELKKLCDMYTPDDDYNPVGYWGIEVLNKHVLSSDNYKISFKPDVIDWFNKNHFDYRGLIPRGIAIDATGKGIY